MKNFISQKIKVSFLVLTMSSFVACGGGNNSVTPSAKNDAYKGETKQLVLTSSSNFIKFVTNANKNPNNTKTGGNNSQLILSTLRSDISLNNIIIPNGLTEGPCQISGSKREKFSQNTETGEITIETTFDNCIETAGVLEDGYQLIVSLVDTKNAQNFTSTSTLKNYTYRDDVEHTISNGTMFVSSSSTTEMIFEMDMVIEDKLLNEINKFEDVYITASYDLNQESFTFSGKIYNSDLGYVTIETPKPIITINGDLNPSSGVMRIIGASENSNQDAIIEIIYQPGDTYTIKFDLNGDGVFEINQSCNWSQPCDILATA